MRKSIWWWLALVCGVLLLVPGGAGRAEDDDDDRGEEHRGRAAIVTNKTHQETCGACHMAYPPLLLPAVSWEKIITNMQQHNGQSVDLGAATVREILTYMKANAADKTQTGMGRRIMKSLSRGAVPLRITDVPAIRRQHQELDSAVFRRRAVGSRGNCIACHPAADKGDFDEDSVHIPSAKDIPVVSRPGLKR